jgi:hypothetical protein
MTWLKKDDRFPEHRKIRRLSDGAYRLHDTALCHVARDESDGLLTPDDLEELTHWSRLRRKVDELITAGLWEPQPDGSYAIHDYLDWNRSHAELEAGREADRRRQAARRENARHAVTPPVTNGVSHAGSHASLPVQTRPDQRETPNGVSPTAAADATAEPDGFADFWAAYPRRDDKGHALKAYRAALHKTDPQALTKAASLFAEQCAHEKRERRFIPLAATWLNGERWNDEAAAEPTTAAAPASREPNITELRLAGLL